MLRMKRFLVVGAIVAATASPTGHAAPGNPPPLGCELAKALARAAVRPGWFPFPQPAGYALQVNGDASPLFGRGLKWVAGTRYFWLARVPGGANLGDPDAKLLAQPYLGNLGRRVAIVRLSFDPRIFAQWPTRGRYPDTTAVVAKGQSLEQVTRFLRSLRRISWPASCP